MDKHPNHDITNVVHVDEAGLKALRAGATDARNYPQTVSPKPKAVYSSTYQYGVFVGARPVECGSASAID
jgi:hypothetical protein